MVMCLGFLRSSFRSAAPDSPSPGDLHRGDRRDHRHDDGDDVEGNAARLDADQRQDQNAQSPRTRYRYRPTWPLKDGQQNDNQFQG